MEEIWKDIPEYECIYQVSNLGRVKSLSNNKTRKEKILKPSKNGSGYYQVVLNKNGKMKTITVHKLVAVTFLNHNPDGMKIVIDHINNVKTDNRLENLQLISARENCSKDKINGSSKYVGVYWNIRDNKWVAQITINNKRKNLGYFANQLLANEAYKNALEMYKNGDLSFMVSKEYSSKYKGVCWNKIANKWKSKITIKGKSIHLGYFSNELEAHRAYQTALNQLTQN
jgi:hypothetical protein